MAAEHGKVVTFYSYKGGTGRTMALANTAWILASNGLRVLAADWDLESPGLHRFFRPFLDPAAIKATAGVIDMVTEYRWATLGSDPRPEGWVKQHAEVRQYAISLDWDFPRGGQLDFLSAGRQNPDYSSAVASLNWDEFYEQHGGGVFFDALRADMRKNYDYTLIDSRTGLSDVADICTMHLPDVLVDCFTLSDQGIDGAAAVAQDISRRFAGRGDRTIRILPVPMRVDEGEKEKADAGRAQARARFEDFPTEMTVIESSRYWGTVEIPYRPFYAYEETLATFGDPPGQSSSVLTAMERLTAYITQDAVTSMPPMEESERLNTLRAFTRRRPPSRLDLLLCYVPEDRVWADWIAKVLTAEGLTITTLDMTAADANTVKEALGRRRAIVVLSQQFVRYRTALDNARQIAETDPSGTRGQLIPVLVSDTHSPVPQLTDRVAANLAGPIEEADALAALYEAVQRPDPPSTTDAARFPGRIPTVWNVQPRNANFTGRNAVLEQLRDQLAAEQVSVVLPVALRGLGGVGKTQVALEYAHRFRADYDLVWWVDAEQSDQIKRSLSELAGQLRLRVSENYADTAREVRDALRAGQPYQSWLLIFDNADEPADLNEYIPTGGNGHVLITSRNQSWTQVATPLEVDVFDRPESVDHLVRRVPTLSLQEAVRMAEILGDLPLAIEIAAAWLAETGTPVEQYLAMLQEESATQLLTLTPPPGYRLSLEATWRISLDRLRERSPAAVRLLELCSCFAPEISVDLIYAQQTVEALTPLDNSLRMPMTLGRVTQELSRLALAKVDLQGRSIQVHRLVQAYMRDQMDAALQSETEHQVHRVLAAARPARGDIDDPANWPQYQMIWPHLGPSQAVECDDAMVRQLLIDRLRYLWKIGDFEGGMALGARLDRTWTAALTGASTQAQAPGERELLHRQLLHMRSQLANIHRSRGQFETAAEVDRAVLAEQQAALGDDDIYTLITAGNLGADLRSLGSYSEALAMDTQTYASFKDIFGDDHERTLAAANNLGVSYRLVGDFQTARELDEDTTERRRRVLGAKHPYSLTSAANLARDLREIGLYKEAIALLQSTYTSFQEVLTENFQETLRAATSLAAALRDAGEHDRARRLTEDTYARYREDFDAETPDAYACRLNLAADYAATGDGLLGVNWAREAHGRYERKLGPDHPYTLAALNNLSVYLLRVEEWQESLQLSKRCCEALTAKLGPDHPYSITASVNLANSLAASGDLDAARRTDEEAYARFRRLLGDEHPDTLVVGANVAIALEALGDLDRARALRQTLLPALNRRLGDQHPTVRAIRDGKRIDREIEPQPA